MSNQSGLILNLQQYIVELETENKALKGHIFSLQNKQENLNSSFHDDIEKLKVYIEHCEHEIMKRQKRQISLLELVNELEEAKEQLTRERDIYLAEVDSIRIQLKDKQLQLQDKQMELQRSSKQIEEGNKLAQAAKPPTPKPSKCRQCEVYIKNIQLMQLQLDKQEKTIKDLQQDLTCLSQFI